MTEIMNVLRLLGVGRNYRGFIQVTTAIMLVLENEERLTSITKDVYMETAQRTGCSWMSVERNIRTVIRRVWAVNPERLRMMAGYPLSGQPTVSEFIEIVSVYIQKKRDFDGRNKLCASDASACEVHG